MLQIVLPAADWEWAELQREWGRAVGRKSKRCIYFKGYSAKQLFLHLISLHIVLDTDQNGKCFWFCFGMIKGEKVE